MNMFLDFLMSTPPPSPMRTNKFTNLKSIELFVCWNSINVSRRSDHTLGLRGTRFQWGVDFNWTLRVLA